MTATTDNSKAAACIATSGMGMSAVAMLRFASVVGEQNVADLNDEIRQKVERVWAGDMQGVEAMLVGQAISLQAVYANFAYRAALQVGDPAGATETYMKLALKAQSQCRATLETLVAIKNPTVVYARQANVTSGPQQINNGIPTRAVEEGEIAQNQLSGENGHELLPDSRTQSIESRAHSTLEALGSINRPKNSRRQGAVRDTRVEGRRARNAAGTAARDEASR